MNYGHPGQFQLVIFASFFPTYLLPYFAKGLTHLEGQPVGFQCFCGSASRSKKLCLRTR